MKIEVPPVIWAKRPRSHWGSDSRLHTHKNYVYFLTSNRFLEAIIFSLYFKFETQIQICLICLCPLVPPEKRRGGGVWGVGIGSGVSNGISLSRLSPQHAKKERKKRNPSTVDAGGSCLSLLGQTISSLQNKMLWKIKAQRNICSHHTLHSQWKQCTATWGEKVVESLTFNQKKKKKGQTKKKHNSPQINNRHDIVISLFHFFFFFFLKERNSSWVLTRSGPWDLRQPPRFWSSKKGTAIFCVAPRSDTQEKNHLKAPPPGGNLPQPPFPAHWLAQRSFSKSLQKIEDCSGVSLGTETLTKEKLEPNWTLGDKRWVRGRESERKSERGGEMKPKRHRRKEG